MLAIWSTTVLWLLHTRYTIFEWFSTLLFYLLKFFFFNSVFHVECAKLDGIPTKDVTYRCPDCLAHDRPHPPKSRSSRRLFYLRLQGSYAKTLSGEDKSRVVLDKSNEGGDEVTTRGSLKKRYIHGIQHWFINTWDSNISFFLSSSAAVIEEEDDESRPKRSRADDTDKNDRARKRRPSNTTPYAIQQ